VDLKFKKRVFQGAPVKARLKTETVVRSFYPVQNTPPVFPVLPYGNMMGGMVPGMMGVGPSVPGPFGYMNMNVPMMMPVGPLNGGGGVPLQQMNPGEYQPSEYQPLMKTPSVDRNMGDLMMSMNQPNTSHSVNGAGPSPPLNSISHNNSNANLISNNNTSLTNSNPSEEVPKPKDNRNRAQNSNHSSNTPGGAHRSTSTQGNQSSENRRKDGGSTNRRSTGGSNGSHAPSSNGSGGHSNTIGGGSKKDSEKSIIEINVANFPPLSGAEDLLVPSPGQKDVQLASSSTSTGITIDLSTEATHGGSNGSTTDEGGSREPTRRETTNVTAGTALSS